MQTDSKAPAPSHRLYHHRQPLIQAIRVAVTGCALVGSSLATPAALAQQPASPENTQKQYDIAGGDLRKALSDFAARAGVLLSLDPALTAGKTTGGLKGEYTIAEGFAELLSGSGLESIQTSTNTYTLQPVPTANNTGTSAESNAERPLDLKAVQVTGQKPGEGFKANYQTSATKLPMSIRQTPQSVSVVTRDSLEARQVLDLGQALETVAGVNQYSGTGPFAGMSPFGFDEISIRGVALDGYYSNREDGFLSPTYFSQPDIVIYDRIEVVKGPSSILYGRASAGGLVNRVRKKPLIEPQAEVAAEIGSFDHYRAEADVTGPLLKDSDRLRGRLVAAYQDSGSFVDGVESERSVFAPSLEVDITQGTRLLLQGSYQRDDFIPNTGFPLQQDGNQFRAPDINRSLFVGVPSADENRWEALTGIAQLEQSLGDNWLATLRLQRSAQDSPVDTDSYAYGINPAGDVYLYSSQFEFDTDVWSGEIRINGEFDFMGRPANVAFGIDHSDLTQARVDAAAALGVANIYQQNFAAFPTMEPTVYRSSVIDNQSTGTFAQFHLRPTERLGVLLSGRYDWADSSYIDELAGTISEKKDEAFTGSAGITFDLVENISVYALYSQSFFPNQFSTGSDGNILDPEEGETYEGGIKTEWLNGRLGINAALFRINRDKIAITDPNNGPGEFFEISSGRQRSDGIELEINGEPLPGWNLSFAGMLLDSEFLEEDDPFFDSVPAGTAEWQVGLFTSYELQTGPLRSFGLGAGLFAIDDRGVSTFIPGATLAGYERVDLKAFYNGFKPLKFALQVRNVTDEKYVEGADRTGAYAQFGSPRAALLTVRYDFDTE